jgi:hypothetical protein
MIEHFFFEYIYPNEYIIKNEIKRLYHIINKDLILKYASKYNNKKLIDEYIKKGTDIFYGLWGACWGGHLDLVKFYLEKVYKVGYNSIFYAYNSGNKEIIDLLEKKYKHNYIKALGGACQGGNIDLIRLCIEKRARDFSFIFNNLCYGGHIELVKIFMNKVDEYYFDGKNLKILKLLENKLNLNEELYGSIHYNNYNISKYLIKKGFTCENINKYKKYIEKLDKYNKLQKKKYLE